MRLKDLDLVIAILVAVINVVWIQVPHRPLEISIIFALPLVFVLPGYMITQTLFGKRSSPPESSNSLFLQPGLRVVRPINTTDHITLSLGLSMAIDIVVGFMLNILPIGLQGLSWILSLGLIVTVFTLLVAFLRHKDTPRVARLPRFSISRSKYTLFGLALIMATIAIWLSVIRPPEPQSRFTQFWMLPAKNNRCEVLIGIHSFEATSETYRVVLTSNNVPITIWPSVVLAPQQEWNQSVPIKSQSANIYADARLYRADKPETIYREVHITLNSMIRSGNQKIMSCD